MLMSQATFSKYIGVSRKTVTQMKKEGLLIMTGKSVDSGKSVERLRGAGREFDENGKLVKAVANMEVAEKKNKPDDIFSESNIPEDSLADLPQDELEEKKRLLFQAAKLKDEFDANNTDNPIDHDKEIDNIDTTEAKKIVEYWRGVTLKQKAETHAGDHILRVDVEVAVKSIARQQRDKAMSMTTRVVHKLKSKEADKWEAILEEEIDDLLESWSNLEQ